MGRIFCVPGESYLEVLDALADADHIDTVVCRHEGGAGLMAVADAKITGRPGVAAVSRGPGATNVSIAIHLAQQDAVPLVVLIGQVARHERGRGAFQEVDYTSMFGAIAKGGWEVADAGRLPEVVARAWHAAQAATPGPALLVLPEDMLRDQTQATVIAPHPVVRANPSAAEIDAVIARLEAAERPVLIERFREVWRGYMLRQNVKAGLNGWAQVNGHRGGTSLRKRLQYDLFYIRNWSLMFDLRILWMTVFRGFTHPNAS